MIGPARGGHSRVRTTRPPMNDSECQPLPAAPEMRSASASRGDADDAGRHVRSVIERHYDFVWRTLQYVGMSAANAEDGAQQVMCVLARRIQDIEPGAETAFLFQSALRVAAEQRRSTRRRPATTEVDYEALAGETPGADELLDERRARAMLSKVLDAIPEDLRLVFVLFEIEELPTPEIAAMLDIPVGTVASRLRRAREAFHAIVRRVKAASRGQGERR